MLLHNFPEKSGKLMNAITLKCSGPRRIIDQHYPALTSSQNSHRVKHAINLDISFVDWSAIFGDF